MSDIPPFTTSTFDSDGQQQPSAELPVRRKRKRKTLVCRPCHKHKQRCDRNLPCSRCIAAERPEQCAYDDFGDANGSRGEETASQTKPTPGNVGDQQTAGYTHSNGSLRKPSCVSVPLGNRPRSAGGIQPMQYSKGKVRCSGSSHWAQLVFQFKEVNPYMFARNTTLADVKKRERAVKRMYPKKKQRAFPFGDAVGSVSFSQSTRLTYLPEHSLVEFLVEYYLVSVEKLFPLFHAATLREELHDFYKSPETVSNSWLAQLYMILVLACYTNPPLPPDASSHVDLKQLMIRLIDGAEATFTQTPFLHRPDHAHFTTIRVLSMIAIAKKFDILESHDHDTLWEYMGFVVRQAMSMWLHRDPTGVQGMPLLEAEVRKRLWVTIVMLDLIISIDSGMPPLCRVEDFSSPAPTPISQQEGGSARDTLDALECAYQGKFMANHAVYAGIVAKVNSPWPKMDYGEVTRLDAQLRTITLGLDTLMRAKALDTMEAADTDVGPTSSHRSSQLAEAEKHAERLQLGTICLITRRVRLALHQPYAREETATEEARTSHYVLLDCALAILAFYDCLAHGRYWNNHDVTWTCKMFEEDWRSATIHVSLGLRRKLFDRQPAPGSAISPHDTAWECLLNSFELSKERLHYDIHHFKSFIGFKIFIDMLKAIDEPDLRPLDVIQKAAFEGYDIVEERMRAINSLTATPSESAVTTGSSAETPYQATDTSDYGIPAYPGIIDPALGGAEIYTDLNLDFNEFMKDMFP